MADEITEVAVYSEDGRSSLLGTFHGWEKRDDGWYGHVMVYGERTPGTGSGMRRDTVPAARLVPMVYCGRLPGGEVRHRCEGRDLMTDEMKVWA